MILRWFFSFSFTLNLILISAFIFLKNCSPLSSLSTSEDLSSSLESFSWGKLRNLFFPNSPSLNSCCKKVLLHKPAKKWQISMLAACCSVSPIANMIFGKGKEFLNQAYKYTTVYYIHLREIVLGYWHC